MSGLGGAADTTPADNYITVRELYDYVARNCLAQTGEAQHPVLLPAVAADGLRRGEVMLLALGPRRAPTAEENEQKNESPAAQNEPNATEDSAAASSADGKEAASSESQVTVDTAAAADEKKAAAEAKQATEGVPAIAAAADRHAPSRRYWAMVGNGANVLLGSTDVAYF